MTQDGEQADDVTPDRDPELLDQLDQFSPFKVERVVWRHMFGATDPATANTRGARWNPPGTAAIYVSLERETALAEAEHLIRIQSPPPSARRCLYQIEVRLSNVIQLSSDDLRQLGVTDEQFTGIDHSACRRIGAHVAWLGHDGLCVPSARHRGENMVVYTANQRIDAEYNVVNREELSL